MAVDAFCVSVYPKEATGVKIRENEIVCGEELIQLSEEGYYRTQTSMQVVWDSTGNIHFHMEADHEAEKAKAGYIPGKTSRKGNPVTKYIGSRSADQEFTQARYEVGQTL